MYARSRGEGSTTGSTGPSPSSDLGRSTSGTGSGDCGLKAAWPGEQPERAASPNERDRAGQTREAAGAARSPQAVIDVA
jgi:hypothetical protein